MAPIRVKYGDSMGSMTTTAPPPPHSRLHSTRVRRRSTLQGFWGMSAALGGMVGTGLANFVSTRFAWHQTFIIPSLMVGAACLIIFKFLRMPTATTTVDVARRVSVVFFAVCSRLCSMHDG